MNSLILLSSSSFWVFQDASDFNVATSSLHALSNSMALTRNDKQSPHSSPRMTRRSATPNMTAQIAISQPSNEIYSNQFPAQQQQPLQSNVKHTVEYFLGILRKNFLAACSNLMVFCVYFMWALEQQPAVAASQVVQSQQMPQMINKTTSNAQAAGVSDSLSTNQNLSAPPLPPRKISPNAAEGGVAYSNISHASNSAGYSVTSPVASSAYTAVNRMLKPQTAVTGATSLVNLSHDTNLSTLLSKSSENVTTCEFDVPKANAPPVPKHNVQRKNDRNDDIDDGLKHINLINMDDKVIVGPAETITGIIDTRPIETRKPITTMSLSSSSSSSAIDSKEQKLVANLYHLKVNMQQNQNQNQIRHQSYPNHMQSIQSVSNPAPSKSQTTPHLGLEYVKLCSASPSSSTAHPNRSNGGTNSNDTRNVGRPLERT